tara:strand:- start:5729 stop:6700 length:972 start_codon:yes stop_codon:yes gene_type:complete
MENKTEPKKRGRKPLPPEEKSKRGRKRLVHQDIQERKQQGAPPLQISFVCDGNETPQANVASSSQTLNPFHDHVVNTGMSEPAKTNKKKVTPQPKKASALCTLEESDDDEVGFVSRRPRVDVSHLSGEKCITLLCAHTDKKKWPAATDKHCWNCTFPFDGIPLAVPAKHHKSGIFTGCFGIFCSFNCARRYLLNRNSQESWQQLQLLSLLHKKILGQTVRIPPAYPFQVLDRFGGYMSIEEYRTNFITLPPKNEMFDEAKRKEYVSMLEKNEIPHFSTILHSHNQKLMTDSLQEKKAREGYDRTTPLPGSQNLAASMGISSST